MLGNFIHGVANFGHPTTLLFLIVLTVFLPVRCSETGWTVLMTCQSSLDLVLTDESTSKMK